MTEKRTQFAYHNIQLYKSESLGSGSYGGVCKAKCDELPCAAKIMHPTLFDLRDPGTASYLRKFQEECHLLSLARHPNVVQYLATCYDSDTRLPVLLMELCDESLTAFLERSPRPLSYHIQISICLDIALALVYLHSNGLIHRDLTGNNVLMIGTRAKITDFGMSKLATGNPRMTALTQCPGNLLYMSPEAVDEAKSYTAKLDIFSFGVIAIQILTRKFPDPTDRFRIVHDPRYKEEVRLVVPETERRQAHLELIPDTDSLKQLALQCLKKENERPSALQLSEKLSELKQVPLYTESVHQAQTRPELQQVPVPKPRKGSEHKARITELEGMMEAKERQLQENQQIIEARDKQLQDKQCTIEEKQSTIATKQRAIETKERQLQQTQQQLQESQQLVEQLNNSLQHKDKTISDLQQTILHHEREIQQLKQRDIASSIQPHLLPVTVKNTQTATVVSVAQKDIRKMTCVEGKKAPERMRRGIAVVHENTAYFKPANSVRVYSYQNILGNEQWSRLPDNPNQNSSLAVIDRLLTSVGGWKNRSYTNVLLSLKGSERKQWSEVFPPMPTPRSHTTCITMEQALVVAGGDAKDKDLATVEVMDINTKQWIPVYPLPQKLSSLSAIVCGNSLYLAGGFTRGSGSKSAFTFSVSDLLQSGPRMRRSLPSPRSTIWKEICSLPVTGSTLASCSGHLLAIGGEDDSRIPSTNVYRYNSETDSWHVVIRMKNKRSLCLAVTFPEDRLIIVGGYTKGGITTDSVEILKEK